jgi:SAM-dependent methyltransferase
VTDHRAAARRLAREALERGDTVGWFDELYRRADGESDVVPWADLVANPNLLTWLDAPGRALAPCKALIVGCGLGDDAEELARRGFDVVAFDVSPTAVDWCTRRFPDTRVQYQVADLFHPPPQWHYAFGFVVEAYTLQVLPRQLHSESSRHIAECVAPGGTLLVVTRGRNPHDDPGQMPWPLTHDDLAAFPACGLEEVRFEDYLDNEQPPVRRFRVEYRRE